MAATAPANGKPRIRAALAAVLALAPAPGGFTVAEMAARVPAMTETAGYTIRQAAYDLRKLRGKNLADAARSRSTDPAATRAHPAAIRGLRRCTARATQGTSITAFGASTAIASTVSRRGQRRPHHTPVTIPTTVEASLYRGGVRDPEQGGGPR